jgi:hypothetical protein
MDGLGWKSAAPALPTAWRTRHVPFLDKPDSTQLVWLGLREPLDAFRLRPADSIG